MLKYRLNVQCQVPRLVMATMSYGKKAKGRTAIRQNLSEQGRRAGPGALVPLVLWWLLAFGVGFTHGWLFEFLTSTTATL